MNSRERVYAALNFEQPDRIPRTLWALPAAEQNLGKAGLRAFRERWPEDFCQCMVGRPPAKRSRGSLFEVGESRDEWGCVFENLVAGVSGEVKDPLLEDWDLDRISPPLEHLELEPDVINAFCHASDQFVFASGWARPFERMQFLRGTEDLLMDLYEEPDELEELIRRVHGFYLQQMELWAKTDIDALVIMDDWGSQQSLLIHPDQWRERFKPLYADYGRVARENGKKLFMHSDGHIFEIYEDLIECGVHAVNSQLFCMDIEEIGRRFAGRLCFWGEIDRQHILPHGTEAETRDAVQRVAANLRHNGGGVIAQFEMDGETKPENAEAVFDEWSRFDLLTK